MKKILLSILAIAMMCFISTGSFTFANADTLEDECDRIFFKTLNEIVEDEGIVTTQNTVTKELVYDLHLNPLGYIYYIHLEDSDGFALAVHTKGAYTINEIYLDAEDPYKGYEGDKVYISAFFYAVWDGENLIETSKGVKIDPEDEIFGENVLYGDYGYDQSTETVYYTNRIVNEHDISLRHPEYEPINLTNGCVPCAGANLIGFYTHFYPELIPGFEPGYYLGDHFIYYTSAPEITPVLATLAEYMGTNVNQKGTTIEGFRNGIIRYCNERGRNLSYYSCMKSGKFDFELAKQYFNDNKPSIMFVNTFTIAVSMFYYDDHETIDYLSETDNHAMAGFGYSEITYTLSNGKTRRDNYIKVATGFAQSSAGYFNVNNVNDIDNYYSISIY